MEDDGKIFPFSNTGFIYAWILKVRRLLFCRGGAPQSLTCRGNPVSLCFGRRIWSCFASSSLYAGVLWLKCLTSCPTATRARCTNTLNPAFTASCNVSAKQGIESQLTHLGELAATMLRTLSWTHADTFPLSPHVSTATTSLAVRFSAVCLPGILCVNRTVELTFQSSSI